MKKTFSIGGVHPADKKISAGCRIEVLPTPQTVYISMSQHLGAPATPVVAVGDKVKAGQKIAEMGQTDADRVMLRFEVRDKGKPVDPAKYLSPRRQ